MPKSLKKFPLFALGQEFFYATLPISDVVVFSIALMILNDIGQVYARDNLTVWINFRVYTFEKIRQQGATKTLSSCPKHVVFANGQVGCQSYLSFGQVNLQKILSKKTRCLNV